MELKNKLEAAALQLHCKPAEFLSYRDLGEDGLSVIAPTGQKFIYRLEELEKMLLNRPGNPPTTATKDQSPSQSGHARLKPPEKGTAPLPSPSGEKPTQNKKHDLRAGRSKKQ